MDVPLPTYPYGKSLYKPYISLYSGCLWVISYYPQESLYKPYKYHGYTVRGTPNCPLIFQRILLLKLYTHTFEVSGQRFGPTPKTCTFKSRFGGPSETSKSETTGSSTKFSHLLKCFRKKQQELLFESSSHKKKQRTLCIVSPNHSVVVRRSPDLKLSTLIVAPTCLFMSEEGHHPPYHYSCSFSVKKPFPISCFPLKSSQSLNNFFEVGLPFKQSYYYHHYKHITVNILQTYLKLPNSLSKDSWLHLASQLKNSGLSECQDAAVL